MMTDLTLVWNTQYPDTITFYDSFCGEGSCVRFASKDDDFIELNVLRVRTPPRGATLYLIKKKKNIWTEMLLSYFTAFFL